MGTRLLRNIFIAILGISALSRCGFWYIDNLGEEARVNSIQRIAKRAETYGVKLKSKDVEGQLDELLAAPLPFLIKVPTPTVVMEPLKWVPFYLLYSMKYHPVEYTPDGQILYRTNNPIRISPKAAPKKSVPKPSTTTTSEPTRPS